MRTLKRTPFPDHPVVASPEDMGKLIRAVRTAAGMTLEETAFTVQVAKQTLQNLEKGTGTVSLALVFQVLAGLGIRLSWQASDSTRATSGKDALNAS
ncbi:MAG: helix-turn-helix domain-containing protein [Burkholderiales bacterium]